MKKFIICILLLFVLILPINIKANKINYNAIQQAGEVTGCGGSAWCWPEVKFGGLVNGLRVSFYDKDGNKVGKSLDFVNNKTALNAIKTTKMYTSNTGYTKLEYLAQGYSINNQYWWWYNYDIVRDIHYLDFSTYLSDKGGASANIFNDYLRIKDLDDIKYKLQAYESYFKFSTGVSIDKMISNPQQYYIIIEPITVLINQGTGRFYYGTYIELQMLRSSYPDGDIPCAGDKLAGVDILFRKNTTSSSGYALAKSIYLGKKIEGNSNFKLSKTLQELKNKTDEKDKNNSDTKYNTYANMLDNGYGIGALWFGSLEPSEDCNAESPNWDSTTKSCVPKTNEFEKCKVLTPELDACATDNGNALQYEYTNCTLDDDDSNYIIGKIDGREYDVARIQCSEKYYVATFQVRNTFHPITGYLDSNVSQGILAGAYYPIDGPVVYHKKTCSFVNDISGWEQYVENFSNNACKKKVTDSCATTTGEMGKCDSPYEIYQSCKAYYEDKKNEYVDAAEVLEQKFFGIKAALESNVTNNLSPDTLPDLKLNTIISNKTTTITYDLTPAFNRLEDLRADYGYGYKTTYIYGLKQKDGLDINRYISLLSSSDAKTSSSLKNSIDLGGAKITTQVNIRQGEYNYNINYKDIFNTTFKNIIKKYGKYNIDNTDDVTSKQCPYTIFSRNIKEFCDENCSDPNETLQTPKINMVYRPISLSNPFPGYSGIGRTTGLNWNTDTIKKYITYNREYISDTESNPNPDLVYQKEPLYTIKLDSTTMKAIREYNEAHAYDDFTLECTEGTGTECFSTFLKEYNLVTSGTCANATTDTFYSCADK